VRRAVVLTPLVTGLSVLVLSSSAAGADPRAVVLPRPAFPPALRSVTPSGPARLVLVSSHARAPVVSTTRSPLRAWMPRRFGGTDLLGAIGQPGAVFLVYGRDGTAARYLVAANPRTHALRYAFDFRRFARPPRVASGAADLVGEQVVWAREAKGTLYVETAHQTYAVSSGGLNGYVAAIDLRTNALRWRSPALVANAPTFVLAGDSLVTGYGFTDEVDYLYLLDRRTGRVRDRLLLPSAPEAIVRRGNRLFVRTYDHDVVAELRRS
jgi:hypothetical protein